ncbi:MAG: polysaccharide lyase [Granulosicoccus sp.]
MIASRSKFGLVFCVLGSVFLQPTSIAQSSPTCSIGEIKQWNSGFVVRDVTIHNNSGRKLNPPRVKVVFNGEVNLQDAWGAFAEIVNGAVVLTGARHNSSLSAGRSARFGFKARGQADGASCHVLESSNEQPNDGAIPVTNDTVVWRDDKINAGSAGQRWRGLNDTQIVADCGGSRGACLEVNYAPTSRGSDRLQTSIDIPPGTDYTLLYDIRFGSNFEFVRGGKLPGLSPQEHTTGCNSARPESWSVRPMWRIAGAAQGYYYGQERSGRCGDGLTSDVGVFKPGQWQEVALRVKLNKRDDSYDGTITLSVDGQEVSRNDFLKLRARITDASKISHMFFSTFYGGSDPSWAPSKTTTIHYDNFRIVDNIAR